MLLVKAMNILGQAASVLFEETWDAVPIQPALPVLVKINLKSNYIECRFKPARGEQDSLATDVVELVMRTCYS